MEILTGYLTLKDKQAIKAILSENKTSGRVGRIDYHIEKDDEVYTVRKVIKDRGMIPCPGSELRLSSYKSTFKL